MPMIVPQIYAKRDTNRPVQIGGPLGLPCTGNTFNAYTFGVVDTGNLRAVATGEVTSCGLLLAASNTNTKVNPPTDFFGGKFFPVQLPGQRFAVSVTDSSGHVGQANSAPQFTAVTVGSKYGIIKLSNGNHALNISDTSTVFFTVVEIPLNWASNVQNATINNYNPVVIVEFAGTNQQF